MTSPGDSQAHGTAGADSTGFLSRNAQAGGAGRQGSDALQEPGVAEEKKRRRDVLDHWRASMLSWIEEYSDPSCLGSARERAKAQALMKIHDLLQQVEKLRETESK